MRDRSYKYYGEIAQLAGGLAGLDADAALKMNEASK